MAGCVLSSSLFLSFPLSLYPHQAASLGLRPLTPSRYCPGHGDKQKALVMAGPSVRPSHHAPYSRFMFKALRLS